MSVYNLTIMPQRSFILKPLLAILMLFMSWSVILAEDQSLDQLDRPIPSETIYNSFDEAIQLIEQRTGFKVSCSEELRTLTQTLLVKRTGDFGNAPDTTVTKFLDEIGEQLGKR
jgi:hypothetical protein